MVVYAFTCPCGGYPTLCHNEIAAQLMSEVCPNLTTKPTLQPVSYKHFIIALLTLKESLTLFEGA